MLDVVTLPIPFRGWASWGIRQVFASPLRDPDRQVALSVRWLAFGLSRTTPDSAWLPVARVRATTTFRSVSATRRVFIPPRSLSLDQQEVEHLYCNGVALA